MPKITDQLRSLFYTLRENFFSSSAQSSAQDIPVLEKKITPTVEEKKAVTPKSQPRPTGKRTPAKGPHSKQQTKKLPLPSSVPEQLPEQPVSPKPAPDTSPALASITTYTIFSDQSYWGKIERCEIDNTALVQENFGEHCAHTDPVIINAFLSSTPSSRFFLLHYAPNWDTNPRPVPILLVHGAGHTANLSWENPFETGQKSLLHDLVDQGFRVFAITFSHPHGDNFLQAEQLAQAVARIREVTGASKVDLVAHSKGGMPTRMYLSSVHRDWGTPYQGDVRRCIMLGTPNKGIDFVFRQSLANYATYSMGLPSCTAWYKVMSCGMMVDITPRSIYSEGGAFPGQAQMLYKWDQEYPIDLSQPDAKTTYYGGKGLISESYGIDYALKQGEYLIDHLNHNGIDPNVEIAVLAGDNNFFAGVVPGEYTGPSDGMAFVNSVLYTDGLTQRGAGLLEKKRLHLDHTQLITARSAKEWVIQHLL